MGTVLEFPDRGVRPERQARQPRNLRLDSGQRFGSIDGVQLSSILLELDKGLLQRWADLCRFMLEDEEILALYTSRIERVSQATFTIEASQYGDQKLAAQARDFIRDRIMPRISNWQGSWERFLGACGVGYEHAEAIPARDMDAGYWYFPELEHVDPNRFRYGPHWEPRLYDKGSFDRSKPSDAYGEFFQPNAWVSHYFPVQNGPPSTYGLLRATVWTWLFKRFTDKSQILLVEKHGHPMLYGVVNPNTAQNVREKFEQGLRELSYDHVAIIEAENTANEPIKQLKAEAAVNSDMHEKWQDRLRERWARLWLGTSDANDPGQNGARAAVEGRLGAFTDPKMVNDGLKAGASMRGSLFRHAIWNNTHLFGDGKVPFEAIPIPEMRLKTADDEVKRDEGDAAEEQQEERGVKVQVPRDAPVVEKPAAAPAATDQAAEQKAVGSAEKVQDLALNGAQVSSMLEIITKVAEGLLMRDNAIELILAAFPTIDRQQAGRIVPERASPQAPQQQEAEVPIFPSTNAARATAAAAEPPKPAPKRESKPSTDPFERALQAMATAERVIICGGPRSGKTTLAIRAGERFGYPVHHCDALLTDDDVDDHSRVKWSGMSTEVASWLDAEPPWIVEGVAAVRGLRKWLKANPGRALDATIVHVSEALVRRSKGQESMSKGEATIWEGVKAAARKAGASVIEI